MTVTDARTHNNKIFFTVTPQLAIDATRELEMCQRRIPSAMPQIAPPPGISSEDVCRGVNADEVQIVRRARQRFDAGASS